jgi:hypothetical protein
MAMKRGTPVYSQNRAMTCRHLWDDPACGSYKRNVERARALIAKHEGRAGDGTTPDKTSYAILEAEVIESHLILKVRYPNCAKCAFEGLKILVFLNKTPLDALRWKVIDPHFRVRVENQPATEAPSPDARFPATDAGWADALQYAQTKSWERDKARP